MNVLFLCWTYGACIAVKNHIVTVTGGADDSVISIVIILAVVYIVTVAVFSYDVAVLVDDVAAIVFTAVVTTHIWIRWFPRCSIQATRRGGRLVTVGRGARLVHGLPLSFASSREIDILGCFRYTNL